MEFQQFASISSLVVNVFNLFILQTQSFIGLLRSFYFIPTSNLIFLRVFENNFSMSHIFYSPSPVILFYYLIDCVCLSYDINVTILLSDKVTLVKACFTILLILQIPSITLRLTKSR